MAALVLINRIAEMGKKSDKARRKQRKLTRIAYEDAVRNAPNPELAKGLKLSMMYAVTEAMRVLHKHLKLPKNHNVAISLLLAPADAPPVLMANQVYHDRARNELSHPTTKPQVH